MAGPTRVFGRVPLCFRDESRAHAQTFRTRRVVPAETGFFPKKYRVLNTLWFTFFFATVTVTWFFLLLKFFFRLRIFFLPTYIYTREAREALLLVLYGGLATHPPPASPPTRGTVRM